MLARAEERKAEIIDGLAAQLSTRLTGEEAALAERFVRAYFRDVAPEDLAERDPLDLYGAALAQLRFSQERQPGQVKLRVYNPRLEQHGWQSTHTIVEIINDDMPFLVDSVSMELNRHGLGIHLVIHPVLAVRRDERGRLLDLGLPSEVGNGLRESFMHVEVDRQSDPEVLAAIERDLCRVLADVRHAVEDWRAMRDKVDEVIRELRTGAAGVPAEELEEIEAFLRWIADDNFTFLGYSAYALEQHGSDVQLRRVKGTSLGIMRGKDDGELSASFGSLPSEVRERARQATSPLIITKANTRSTVHRSTYLDFIGIKRFAPDGTVTGEHRFLGLLTSAAYNTNPRLIPLLRRKVERILARSGFSRTGHAGKALLHILETYPRDELLQTSEDELFKIVMGILQLQDRQRLRLFIRTDPFGRFVSCLVFVPRDRYNTLFRERVQHLLEQAFRASESEFQALLSESNLARLLFTLKTPHGIPADLDTDALERRLIEASRSWVDRLREALLEAAGEETGNRLFELYGRAFPASYQERVDARAAVPDIRSIDRLSRADGAALALTLYRRLEDPPEMLRFKLIRRDQPVLLSDVLPILENMGLRVLTEEPSTIRAADGRLYALHDFGLRPVAGGTVDVDAVREHFQDLFLAVWSDRLENDGFNRLVLAAGLGVREIVILRAYCKYILQIGTPFSQAYIEQTLIANPALARDLVRLFDLRFNPSPEVENRLELQQELEALVLDRLNRVSSLDQDRILRRYLELIRSTLRTNAWQRDPVTGLAKDYVSFKFDPRRIPGLPAPRPAFEIFVYAPYVEGVHLRGGKVARGGLRWSDRREDFRTEILGLMKAQMVKNAVIVPVGAKGGFVVKRPPASGDRAALQEEGIRCYKTLLRGLLDITDNQLPSGIVPPPEVVRYDTDDPYLVVAADKGTATFSDIANGISREYGFWLDDAFASGGSAGYDHKAMGITAKGAWESVKRHFRELGLDPQQDPFTVIGIGDMSGDVFGNGMLLSDRIKLVAAFDHRHIFVDPDPDPARSYEERKRLFALPRSSWDDYDRSVMSAGGGVWPRTAKAIPVSPAMRRALGIEGEAATLTPNELMSAILKAPVDLFWNGGIGTFVKAASESHADAQDRLNDAIRVNGEDLRCRVVAEGGNLGFTQKGRVEFALRGGRINTDFIDNSAGVDCSDHEVNIKILLGEVVRAGDLTMKQRDELLEAMTDEVAELVLRDNVLQNLALSITEALGLDLLDAEIRLMRRLEAQGRLDRELERLPGDAELAERRKIGRGLTRPEQAVLLAYAKMTLYEDLLGTELPDRAYLAQDIAKYFPRPLRRRFAAEIERHRLKREIVATWIANSVVNRGLAVFVAELEDETGGTLEDVMLSYVAARDAFNLLQVWGAIEAVPATVPAALQTRMFVAARDVLLRGTRWFMTQSSRPLRIRDTVSRFRPGIAVIMRHLDRVVSGSHASGIAAAAADYVAAGVEPELARTIAGLPHLLSACDIVWVCWPEAEAVPADERLLAAARVHFALDAALDLPWLKRCIQTAPRRDRWDRLALTGLEDDLSGVLRGLTAAALAADVAREDAAATAEGVGRWLEAHLLGLARYRELVRELQETPAPDLAMLTVAVRSLGELLPRRAPV
ncbi:NAD-glutamate dehydrogenase [Benzoatithermus flavus]|uniref:NAD-glutamate dehydrogenase n=1 Tax=Benzoatithermus flavus TaxID=3108223 RepID=A0ABU8XVL9_9PROT